MSEDEAASGSEHSLEEPLFEEDQEISSGDEEKGREDSDGENQANGGEADEPQGADQPQEEETPRAKALTRPVPMTKAEREKHLLEGHAVYHPGCEFCVRTRGLSDRHRRVTKTPESFWKQMMSHQSLPWIFASYVNRAKIRHRQL